MTTRPTTDGDTKAAIDTVRRVTDWSRHGSGTPRPLIEAANEALDSLVTRISEQESLLRQREVELERCRRILGDKLTASLAAMDESSEANAYVFYGWECDFGVDGVTIIYAEKDDEPGDIAKRTLVDHGHVCTHPPLFLRALTPTTQDREGSAPGVASATRDESEGR